MGPLGSEATWWAWASTRSGCVNWIVLLLSLCQRPFCLRFKCEWSKKTLTVMVYLSLLITQGLVFPLLGLTSNVLLKLMTAFQMSVLRWQLASEAVGAVSLLSRTLATSFLVRWGSSKPHFYIHGPVVPQTSGTEPQIQWVTCWHTWTIRLSSDVLEL